jgi:uncharacterized protein YdiU (UPF0061 family)
MHALGIPTTRALAATVTGEKVFRERVVCRHYSVWQKIQAINAGSGVRFYATNPSS